MVTQFSEGTSVCVLLKSYVVETLTRGLDILILITPAKHQFCVNMLILQQLKLLKYIV